MYCESVLLRSFGEFRFCMEIGVVLCGNNLCTRAYIIRVWMDHFFKCSGMTTANHILIVDFGSQYTQLIARRVRELSVYCRIVPYHTVVSSDLSDCEGVILSGGPASVLDEDAPRVDAQWLEGLPVLGICYGAQWIAQNHGASIEPSEHREYGRAHLNLGVVTELFRGVSQGTQVWMSHGDAITQLPQTLNMEATTAVGGVCAAYRVVGKPVYGLQFHPEVYHTDQGSKILENYVISVCGMAQDWVPETFVSKSVEEIRTKVSSDQRVLIGLSGGVDSSVAAMIVHRAVGDRLHGIFVNNGLLRLGEYESVLEQYRALGLPVKGVDASDAFLDALEGVDDPEVKRKVIGKIFIDVFEKEAEAIGSHWLVQGTIYPDVIESVSIGTKGAGHKIKSHHNVGGLPERMKLRVLEPLRMLFKDEVRKVGLSMGLPSMYVNRHPFPGPGLAIRILGAVDRLSLDILRKADDVFIGLLRTEGLYDKVWQAGVMLLPVYSVGVMGDQRTYEKVVALRAVTSTDGMTADWVDLPHVFLAKVSTEIINKVKGVNRVVYDISSKPPATIEWE